jgi:hypothetical protein
MSRSGGRARNQSLQERDALRHEYADAVKLVAMEILSFEKDTWPGERFSTRTDVHNGK